MISSHTLLGMWLLVQYYFTELELFCLLCYHKPLLLIKIIFPFTSHNPKTPVPVVNNPIRYKIPWPNMFNFTVTPARDWQAGCLWWEVMQSQFHVDLKSNFALKNNSMQFLLSPITRQINVMYESRKKWTWHHSRFTVEEVNFFGRPRVVLLQLISIHDGAVGVTDLGVMLLCLWECLLACK